MGGHIQSISLDAAFKREKRRECWRISQARRRAKLRARVDELFPPEPCQRCHRYEPLEFAHIKPTQLRGRSRGYTETLKDVLENIECYARLCRECHVALDRGEVGLELEEAPF